MFPESGMEPTTGMTESHSANQVVKVVSYLRPHQAGHYTSPFLIQINLCMFPIEIFVFYGFRRECASIFLFPLQ